MLAFWGRMFKKIGGLLSLIIWLVFTFGGVAVVKTISPYLTGIGLYELAYNLQTKAFVAGIIGFILGFLFNTLVFGILGLFCDIDEKVTKLSK